MLSNYRQKVTEKISKSSPTDLIDSAEIREVLNLAADEIRDKGLFIIGSVAELGQWNNSEANHIGVKDVGIFKYLASGTVDNTTNFASVDGGVWQLVLPVGSSSGSAETKQTILDKVGSSSTTEDGFLSAVDFGRFNDTVTNFLNHKTNTNNPHNVTKTQIGLGNVPNVDTTTTANITDSTNKRFINDAQKATLSNTSGVNTGDQDISGIATNATNLASEITNRTNADAALQTQITQLTTGGSETTATIKTKLGVASNTTDGYLTQGDWAIFAAKAGADTIGTTPLTTSAQTLKEAINEINAKPSGSGATTFVSANGYFDDGVGGFTPTSTATVSNSSVYGLNDPLTGEPVVYKEATTLKNGTTITDAHIDTVMIRKKGTKYYKRVADNGIKAHWYLKPGTQDTIVGGISQNAVKLQKALNFIKNNGGGTLEFWDGDYTVTPTATQSWSLKPSSNTQIRGYNGARILCGTTGLGSYKIIYVSGVDNVVIKGVEIVGDRDTNPGDGTFYPDGTTPYGGESGMGVYVENSTKVVMQDLKITKTWGDGIYVGNFLCKNILVDNVYVDNVRRNGMTITYVDGMVVSNSWFINTKGIPPENGIDIETNALTSVQNVLLANLILTNNNSDGIGIAGSKIQMVNVRSMYNTMRGLSISGQNVTHHQWADYDISTCTFEGNGYSGIDLLGGGGRISINNCTIAANGGLMTFHVTGVTTTPAVGARYYINGLEYTVKAANITTGAGTIDALCTNASGALLPLSGKLFKKGFVTLTVSGITDTPINNEVYNINGSQWFIEDTNITAGSGTIRMQLASPGDTAIPSGGDAFKVIGAHQNSFTYTAVSYDTVGDAMITYSSFTTLNDFNGIYCYAKGPVKLTNNRILNNNGRAIITAQYNNEDMVVMGNTIAGNTGASVFDNSNGTFIGNIVHRNHSFVNNVAQANEGAVTFNGNGWAVNGNSVYKNQQHGIFIEGNNNTVVGNNVHGNSQAADNTYQNIIASSVASNNIIQSNNIHKLGGRITLTVSGLSSNLIQQEALGVDPAEYLLGTVLLRVLKTSLSGTAPTISGTIIVEQVGKDAVEIPASGTITRQSGVGPNSIAYSAYSVAQPQFGILMRVGTAANNYVANNGTVGKMGRSGDIRDDNAASNNYAPTSTGATNNWDIGGALGLPNRLVATADATKVLNATTDSIILLDATAGSFTFTLATAVTANKRIFEFKRIDTNTNAVVTIASEGGSHYIDGTPNTTYLLYAKNSQGVSEVKLYCSDPNWHVLSAFTAPDVPSTLTYAATTNIDFNAGKTKTLALTGNVTFTTSNRTTGREKMIVITAGAADRALTFPAWKFLNSIAPTSIVNGKTAVLSLSCFGPNDTDVIATYAIEPDLA